MDVSSLGVILGFCEYSLFDLICSDDLCFQFSTSSLSALYSLAVFTQASPHTLFPSCLEKPSVSIVSHELKTKQFPQLAVREDLNHYLLESLSPANLFLVRELFYEIFCEEHMPGRGARSMQCTVLFNQGP